MGFCKFDVRFFSEVEHGCGGHGHTHAATGLGHKALAPAAVKAAVDEDEAAKLGFFRVHGLVRVIGVNPNILMSSLKIPLRMFKSFRVNTIRPIRR